MPAEYDTLSDVEDPVLERMLAVLDATELSVVESDDVRVDWVASELERTLAVLDAMELPVVVNDDVKVD